MNCSICHDDITKETGSTILTCEHTFHFRCITRWFVQQYLKDIPETCPCCRDEGKQLDRSCFLDMDEEEEEEEEEEDDPPAPQQEGERVVVYHWTREQGVIVDFPPNYIEELEEVHRQRPYISSEREREQIVYEFRQRKKTREEEAARKIQIFFRESKKN